ncbi:ATP synthase subunit e, mitochondrial isoform X1 [Ursus americanus]|uniref:ATP synthase subunit e, mitochondrial isoform X1 n=1 Tax=Ursus americanus TaxID=9643 RepID=UPI001E679E5F|nr:ATP synthase subunit e, mitochondrial isoform X1 [Ursus americanus]
MRSWSPTARLVWSPPREGARCSTSVHQGTQSCSCSPPTAHAFALVRFYDSVAFRALAASCSGCASGAKVTDKMVPPVQVSPLIKVNLALRPSPGARLRVRDPRVPETCALAARPLLRPVPRHGVRSQALQLPETPGRRGEEDSR